MEGYRRQIGFISRKVGGPADCISKQLIKQLANTIKNNYNKNRRLYETGASIYEGSVVL